MLCPSLQFYMSLRFYMQQKQDKLIHVNIRVAVSEVKNPTPTPTFLKFPIPTPESDSAFPNIRRLNMKRMKFGCC